MIKYKQGELESIIYKIDGDSKISFSLNSKPKTMGYGLLKEYEEWVAGGGEIEHQYTDDELIDKEIEDEEVQIQNQKSICKNLLNASEIHVSNDPPYPDDVEEWKNARKEWRKILKSDTLQEIYPKPF